MVAGEKREEKGVLVAFTAQNLFFLSLFCAPASVVWLFSDVDDLHAVVFKQLWREVPGNLGRAGFEGQLMMNVEVALANLWLHTEPNVRMEVFEQAPKNQLAVTYSYDLRFPSDVSRDAGVVGFAVGDEATSKDHRHHAVRVDCEFNPSFGNFVELFLGVVAWANTREKDFSSGDGHTVVEDVADLDRVVVDFSQNGGVFRDCGGRDGHHDQENEN